VRIFFRGDVGGDLQHLDDLAIGADDRVVAGLNPDFAAVLGEALVLPGIEQTRAQALPEQAVLGCVTLPGVHEHAVVATLDLVECVAQHLQEVGVGVQHVALGVEADEGLRAPQRLELQLQQLGLGAALLQHLLGGGGLRQLLTQRLDGGALLCDQVEPVHEVLGLDARLSAERCHVRR